MAYAYDASGNQVLQSRAGVATRYAYDSEDQLRSVHRDQAGLGEFLYDYRGLRVEKLGERGTERSTYDGTSVLLQSDTSGAMVAKYEYGADRPLSIRHRDQGSSFYLLDALGSVVTLTTASGAIQQRTIYDAWGRPRSNIGNSWNRLAFTGHEEDRETGLLYAEARFYDRETARFLNQDAVLGEVHAAPSLHRYLYGYGNPTVYVDPDGRQTTDAQPSRPKSKPRNKTAIPRNTSDSFQTVEEALNAFEADIRSRPEDELKGGEFYSEIIDEPTKGGFTYREPRYYACTDGGGSCRGRWHTFEDDLEVMLIHSHPFDTEKQSRPTPSETDKATSLQLHLPGAVISDPPDGPAQVIIFQRFSEDGQIEDKVWQLTPELKEIAPESTSSGEHRKGQLEDPSQNLTVPRSGQREAQWKIKMQTTPIKTTLSILSCAILATSSYPLRAEESVDCSIIELIATPERFSEARVRTSGFLVVDFEEVALYLSSSDADYRISHNGLSIEFSNANIPQENIENTKGHYVLIEGRFRPPPKDSTIAPPHRGTLYDIERIVRLDQQPNHRKDSR